MTELDSPGMPDFDRIFENLIMPWFYTKPIFFKLFCLYNIRPNPQICVPFRSGKKLIEYNPELLKEKNLDQLRAELLLELERILLRHPFRRPAGISDFDKILWYQASTMTLTQNGVNYYGFESNQSIEYYYKKLSELESDDDETPADQKNDFPDFPGFYIDEEETEVMCEEASAAEESEADTDAGAGKGNEESEDGSELWTCDDEQSDEEISQFISQNNMNWGDTPSFIKQMISMNKKAKIPSCINLLEYFKGIRGKGDRTTTRMRPSRRFGYAQMGSKSRYVPGRILVGVDVSGSIADSVLKTFYGAICNVFDKSIKYIDIFQFDTQLKTEKPVLFKKRSSIQIQGRGGTSFQPIFDYAIKHQNTSDGLIIFTHGFAPPPVIHHKLRTKVLWVINTAQNYELVYKDLKETGLVTALLEKNILRTMFGPSLMGEKQND